MSSHFTGTATRIMSKAMNKENDNNDIVRRLRAELNNDRAVEYLCSEAADEIERLRAERDDARMRYCSQQAALVKMATPQQIAENIHWDCYDARPRDEARMECEDVMMRNQKLTAEAAMLRAETSDLRKRIGDASIIMYDWDGYYNPNKQTGNIVELAKLIEEAYRILQGRSWNEEDRK